MAYINFSTPLNTVGTLLKLIWALLYIIMHFEPDPGINFVPVMQFTSEWKEWNITLSLARERGVMGQNQKH